jgi:TPR repeat protein
MARLDPGRRNSAARLAMIGAVALLVAAPARAEIGMEFEPPPLARLKCTATPAPPAMSRDWSTWQGEPVDVAPRDLLLVARAYADGTDSLDPDPKVARRILETIVAGKSDATASAREALARLMLVDPADKPQTDGAIKQLEQAVAERDVDAAISLGKYFENGGPVPRDPAKALAYYRMGATVGNSAAILGIARLAKAGAVPGMTPEQVDEAVRQGILALLTDVGRGNCESLYWIGRLYDSGDLVPLNAALAGRWYETAARAIGHSKAAEKLARMYQKGNGVEMSLPKAFEFLSIAAKGGRTRAMVMLAQAYALGDGTARDVAQSIGWFEKANGRGEQSSLRWLARLWRGDFGGNADLARAFTYLKRDADRANPESKTFFELGEAYLDGAGTSKNVDAGIEALRKAAALGLKDAADVIGDVYRYGQGVPADPLRAARYYRQAAAFGNVDAMSALADLHQCGLGVPWSPRLEQKWRESAAFNGSGSSLYDLAAALPRTGAPADAARRFRLLNEAAALGSREAMVLVAIAYEKGDGVPADKGAADTWRGRALAPGDDVARGYLALAGIYENGDGVPIDLAKARGFLEEIADQGDSTGQYALARFLADHGGARVSEAMDNMVAAAVGGNPTAMRSLSQKIGFGQTVGGKDRQGWLNAAALAGDVRARIAVARQSGEAIEAGLDHIAAAGACRPEQMADLAIAYLALASDSGKAKAADWLNRAIAIGANDQKVSFALGQTLAAGDAGPDLRTKGLALLTQAARSGMIAAMRQLAAGYQTGAWGAVDTALAGQWLEQAAAAGDAPSAVDFAKSAASGGGDLTKAHTYLAKAAEGSTSAARQLGQLSIQGLFGEAEQAKGVAWLEKAAAAGDISAMRDLADMLSTGAGGVRRDPAGALEWLRKAATGGDAKAMFKLAAAYEAGFGTSTDAQLADQWYARARQAGSAGSGGTQ